MDDSQARILVEQINRLAERLESRFAALEDALRHQQALDAERHTALREVLAGLHALLADHEERLREASAGVQQFKTIAGLAGGGSALASLAALIRSFWGH